MIRNIISVCTAVLLVLCSCDKNPIDGEQYFKQVYLIGAQDLVREVELSYSSDFVETFITVSTSGSQPIEEDVSVKLKIDPKIINDYNEKYFESDETEKFLQNVQEDLYNVPSLGKLTIVAKEGISANLPVFIKTENLNPDLTYAIPFSILDVDNYVINDNLRNLILKLKLINSYSGDYSMTGERINLSSGVMNRIQKNKSLKAIGVNKLRMFHSDSSENTDIDDNGIVIEIQDDNSVSVKSWNLLEDVIGEGVYSPETKTIEISYSMNWNQTEYQVSETLTLLEKQ